MTLSEVTFVGLLLVVFLNNLIHLRLYLRYAQPEIAVIFYIISKLLPRFQELSEYCDEL